MAKVFAIADPEQLTEISAYVKADNKPDGLTNFAKVWTVERRKGQKTPWEGCVFVAFETVGRGRRAYVFRQKSAASKRMMAAMKYQPALDWATKNLEMIDAAI